MTETPAHVRPRTGTAPHDTPHDTPRTMPEAGPDEPDPWEGIPAELLSGGAYDVDTAGGCG
ncbi:hypothetical protein E1293_09490 [Actinomadura darangshiensis]|uniref:Uncharacterized protein n=1 Tax=Actinomadura darangshiensis TaxID=705336 RepID=A0A4R5BMJ0_9ACTN|nr:hypothetical protein [Actinomadura darangshiensis]TDD86536.1 hypothetical protein E1293_09490 [Actinomadura darangshiensis]